MMKSEMTGLIAARCTKACFHLCVFGDYVIVHVEGPVCALMRTLKSFTLKEVKL